MQKPRVFIFFFIDNHTEFEVKENFLKMCNKCTFVRMAVCMTDET